MNVRRRRRQRFPGLSTELIKQLPKFKYRPDTRHDAAKPNEAPKPTAAAAAAEAGDQAPATQRPPSDGKPPPERDASNRDAVSAMGIESAPAPAGAPSGSSSASAAGSAASSTASEERSAACTVCLSAIEEGDSVIQLPPCGHTFHSSCATPWLRRSATCPNCRMVVLPERLKHKSCTIEDDEKTENEEEEEADSG